MFPEASMWAFPNNDLAWMTVEFVPLDRRSNGKQARAGIGYARVAWARVAVNERLYCVGARIRDAGHINLARRHNSGVVRLGSM